MLEKSEVWETVTREKNGKRYRHYKVKLTFLPYQYYKVCGIEALALFRVPYVTNNCILINVDIGC